MSILTWTDERIERLKELYAQGCSCSWIAADLGGGISRNATIGKIHRLGLERRGSGRHPISEKRSPRSVRRAVELKPIRVRRPVITPAQEIKLRCVEIVPRNISLMDLEPNDCRYPYGDCGVGDGITFCGHPKIIGGSSYCPAHFVLTRGTSFRNSEADHERRRRRFMDLSRQSNKAMVVPA